ARRTRAGNCSRDRRSASRASVRHDIAPWRCVLHRDDSSITECTRTTSMSRILVAEDEAGIASFVVKGLTAAGHTATVASDGDVALAAGQSDAFDLIVLDLGLPKRDGLTVLRELRDSGVHTPVIILTAREGIDDLVGGLDAARTTTWSNRS